MGFPLIMYLSRAKTMSLWPDLEQPHDSERYFQGVKSELTLSLKPKLSISAEWKKPEPKLPPRRDDTYWPPADAESIVEAIETLLAEQKQVGTVKDLMAQKFKHSAYKLCGTFKLDSQASLNFGDIGLKAHGLSGHLHLADTKHSVALTLALNNVAGIELRNGNWDVGESGAIHFLHEARAEGYPLIGLFTYEGAYPSRLANCGAVYFASYWSYLQLKESTKRLAKQRAESVEPEILGALERGFRKVPKLLRSPHR
jgi:hypothetical protein